MVENVRRQCRICAGSRASEQEDLNVLNFERVRWGGARHGDLIYTLLDLQKLSEQNIPSPSARDVSIFKKILQTAESSRPGDPPGALRDRLEGVLPSTKHERSILLEILASAGILVPTVSGRGDLGGRHDWQFVKDWRGEDKYDRAAVEKAFGKWL